MAEIICDNKRLIFSNRICCISNDSVSLGIDMPNGEILNIIFNFHYEDGDEIKTTMNSPENGKVVFVNNTENATVDAIFKATLSCAGASLEKTFEIKVELESE